MSRIGKEPITVPDGVTVKIEGSCVTVSGPKGELQHIFPAAIQMAVDGKQVVVSRANDEKLSKALHGTNRSLVANMVEGVLNGYKKELKIDGVGYRASVAGQMFTVAAGFSHPIEYQVMEGVTVETPDPTRVIITGCDKQKVGQVAARIRGFSPAEPYKGKGISYKGEKIRRKAGKTVA